MRHLFLFVALLLLPGCVDLVQKVQLQTDGSVAFEWKLGLNTDIAMRTRSPERDSEFLMEVARAAGDAINGTIHVEDGLRWYVLEGTLPDVDAYDAFRSLFIARFGTYYNRDDPMLYPPVLADGSLESRFEAAVDAPNADRDTEQAWRLELRLPEGTESTHNADEVLSDGALVWERPTTQVMRSGLEASASWGTSTGRSLSIALIILPVACLVVLLAGLALVRRRAQG